MSTHMLIRSRIFNKKQDTGLKYYNRGINLDKVKRIFYNLTSTDWRI
jgi:hypothetical protein